MTTLRFIHQHPGGGASGVGRFIKWQVLTRLNPQKTVLVPWVGNTRLAVKRGQHGLTGNIYCTLLEYDEMGFLLKSLRAEDTFVDVGANGGSYTILAAGCIGSSVLAFEPVSENLQTLKLNVDTNQLSDRVTIFPVALADYQGLGTMVIPDSPTAYLEQGHEGQSNGASIPVDTLDSLLKITAPTFIKIDVEGGEASVLRGAHQALQNPLMVAAVIEMTWRDGSLTSRSQGVLSLMDSLGYAAYSYDFKTNQLERGLTHGQANAFLTRDHTSLLERLAESKPKTSLATGSWRFVTEKWNGSS